MAKIRIDVGRSVGAAVTDSLGRRRDSWDYVQQRADVAPDRPLDTWRICGQWLYGIPGRNCMCTNANPSDEKIAEACARLGMDAPLPRKRRRRR